VAAGEKKPVGKADLPPVVCVVGKSGAGKTTFLEKLIRELKSRGLRVGTVKHHHGDFEIDRPGKDSWRHARAGADAVCVAGPRRAALVRRLAEELSLAEIVPLLGDVDIVLAEGYKREDRPQIEVLPSSGAEPVARKEKLICTVGGSPEKTGVPCFDPEDARGVADFLFKSFPGLMNGRNKE
jgi:molybdopterin-guanine dinucleotide biosynthesis protein B